MCWRCLSIVSRGIGHNCTLTQRRENLFNELSADERGSEIYAAHVIKSKAIAGHGDIQLSTGGRKLTLTSPCNTSSKSAAFNDSYVPAEEMSRFQQTLGLSRQQTRTAAQFFRKWKGRKSVEACLESKLQRMDECLKEFFTVTKVEFETSNNRTECSPVVFCKDPSGLIDCMLEHRSAGSEFVAKIGMDSGGDFLKITLSLLTDTSSNARDISRHTACASSSFVDGGVKKIMLLAIAQGVRETYKNLKNMLDLLDMQGVRYYASMDMKMANIFLGLQACSSTHPCPWCECPKNDFGKAQRSISMRTLGSIRTNAARYQQAAQQQRGNLKLGAAEFKNCVQVPLINLPTTRQFCPLFHQWNFISCWASQIAC